MIGGDQFNDGVFVRWSVQKRDTGFNREMLGLPGLFVNVFGKLHLFGDQALTQAVANVDFPIKIVNGVARLLQYLKAV